MIAPPSCLKVWIQHCYLPPKLLQYGSLRSKRFQSSYCAKVRAKAKKNFPSPSPVIHFFLCSCPSFLDEPREETLARQANNTSPMLLLFAVVAGQGQGGLKLEHILLLEVH